MCTYLILNPYPSKHTSTPIPMAEVLGVIFGIALPALHGIRLLKEDIESIKDAPEAIKDVHRQLELLQLSIESFKSIEREQWEGL